MRIFQCNSLVPGCKWHTRAEQDAEIVRRVAEHLRTAHNEKIIRPNLVVEIKKRITEEQAA